MHVCVSLCVRKGEEGEKGEEDREVEIYYYGVILMCCYRVAGSLVRAFRLEEGRGLGQNKHKYAWPVLPEHTANEK